jgi:hypothetical protein
MESPPKSVKYHVQVVRLRFDAAIIEVQASDDSDAERKAIEQAQRLMPAAKPKAQQELLLDSGAGAGKPQDPRS